MKPDTQREAALFQAAAQLAGAARAAFLDGACLGDPALRQRLEVLLAAHEADDSLLDTEEAKSSHDPLKTMKLDLPDVPDEAVGTTLGRYKLLERVGEGGCGVVYVAEQTEPVRRRVALKVIKLGMDTKQVVARFEAERQALAMMDHPNIAKVLDAGTTETGRPYFVMELVRGIRITDYCDQANLSTKERLGLFMQVCHAIQHAHQKGIIHRDIKPSNILVTMHDGVPVPKVIDFGIAKATEGRLTDLTLYTELNQFIGTPAYMSPEQAEMSGLDIDTRSDIYALGVLLYELLTGQTPFDGKELLKSGIDEIRRKIRELEPPKPSTRLSTMLHADLSTVAKHHAAEPSRFASLVRGDLDWIVMKCLEKDRTRRYDTANGLAADIKRHLSNEPVVARQPSAAYKFQKSWRRNKLTYAAVGAIVMALMIGLGVSTWLFFRESAAHDRALRAEKDQARLREQAETERKAAQTESARSRQVAKFLKDMLEGAGPKVAQGRDTTMLQEILDRTTEQLPVDLKDQPEVEAELRMTIGHMYFDLGERAKAEVVFREALRLRRQVFGNEHPLVAETLRGLSTVMVYTQREAEALALLREAEAMLQKLALPPDENLAAILDIMSRALRNEHQFAEAEAYARKALAIRNQLYGVESKESATSGQTLATVLTDRGKLDEAESLFRQVLKTRLKVLGEAHPHVGQTYFGLAQVLEQRGALEEAAADFRKSLDLSRMVLGEDHYVTKSRWKALKTLLEKMGRTEEVELLYREGLNQARAQSPSEPIQWDANTILLADYLRSVGKFTECLVLYSNSLEVLRATLGDDAAETLQRKKKVAELTNIAKARESTEQLKRALSEARSKWTNDPVQLDAPLAQLANNLLQQEQYSQAEPLLRELLTCRRKRLPPHDVAVIHAGSALATCLAETKVRHNFREASDILGEVLPPLAETTNVHARALDQRGNLLARLGEWRTAADHFERVLQISPNSWVRTEYLATLVELDDQVTLRKLLHEFIAATPPPSEGEGIAWFAKMIPVRFDPQQAAAVRDLYQLALSGPVNKMTPHLAYGNFGFLEYRLGTFTNAVQWIEKAQSTGLKDIKMHEAQIQCVLAMSKYGLGQTSEAAAALALAKSTIEANEKHVKRIGIEDRWWMGSVAARALCREANDLIEGKKAALLKQPTQP